MMRWDDVHAERSTSPGRPAGWGAGVFALALTLSATAHAEMPGHLQIPAQPGVVAEVDERMSARAQDRYGIIIRELAPGPHRLVLRRPGYHAQSGLVEIAAGRVTFYQPQPWRTLTVDAQQDAPTGLLMVQTLPVEATIKAKSLGWPEFEKPSRPFQALAPAGLHRITICNDYRCLDYRVRVARNRLRSLFIDMDRGTIEDLSDLHARDWKAQRQVCASTGAPVACRSACEMDIALLPADTSNACKVLWPPFEAPRPATVPVANAIAGTGETDAPLSAKDRPVAPTGGGTVTVGPVGPADRVPARASAVPQE